MNRRPTVEGEISQASGVQERVDGPRPLLAGAAASELSARRPTGFLALEPQIRLPGEPGRELTRLQTDLAAADRRYRALFDLSPVAYVTLDGLGQVLEANAAAARIVGRPTGLAVGEPFSALVAPEHQDSWSLWRRLLLGGASRATFELKLRRADGTLARAEVVASPGGRAPGGSSAWTLSLALIDVTERRQLEIAARDSTEQIHRLFDRMPFLISQIDREHRYAFVNHAHEAWFRTPAQAVAGRAVRDLIGPVSYAWLGNLLEAALCGETATGAGELKDAAGDIHWVSATFASDLDASGEQRGVYCLLQDMTDLRRAQIELQEVTADATLAEQRIRSHLAFELHDDVSQLLACTSIKLRQLRSAIEVPASSPLDEIADLLAQVRNRISSLTFQLHPPVLHDKGLRAAAEWLAEELRWMHGLKVRIENEPGIDDPDEASRIVLFRTLRELLLNIARHSQATEAFVALRGSTSSIEMEVRDQGLGFDTTRELGFGLESLHVRINQLGGKLTVESIPGLGTTARVWLPKSPDPSEETR